MRSPDNSFGGGLWSLLLFHAFRSFFTKYADDPTLCCHLVCKVSSTPKACGLFSCHPRRRRVKLFAFVAISPEYSLQEIRRRLKIRRGQPHGGSPPLPAPIKSVIYEINASSDAFFCPQTVPKLIKLSRRPDGGLTRSERRSRASRHVR
jgi:hypothetical protein